METAQDKPNYREEHAIVLDFLQHGYPFDKTPSHRKDSIVQAVGINKFTLLELVPKEGVFLQPHEKIYIGEGKRDKIHHIIGKLPASKLTTSAQKELAFIVNETVCNDEKRFVEFFNKAQPLTMRMHQVELLPGFGKKHMWEIIEKRADKPFVSFADLKARVKLMPDPAKAIAKRILDEILGEEKHRLFVDAP